MIFKLLKRCKGLHKAVYMAKFEMAIKESVYTIMHRELINKCSSGPFCQDSTDHPQPFYQKAPLTVEMLQAQGKTSVNSLCHIFLQS